MGKFFWRTCRLNAFVFFAFVVWINFAFLSSVTKATLDVRAVWFFYGEVAKYMRPADRTRASFEGNVAIVFDNLRRWGVHAVALQVMSHCDAGFRSAVFPSSASFAGKQGEVLPYDPLEIFLEMAHAAGIQVFAWFTPLRIVHAGTDAGTDTTGLAPNNPGLLMLHDGHPGVADLRKDGIWLDAGNPFVQELCLRAADEILDYQVDGLIVDDRMQPRVSIPYNDAEAEAYNAARWPFEQRIRSKVPFETWQGGQPADAERTPEAYEEFVFAESAKLFSLGRFRCTHLEALYRRIHERMRAKRPNAVFILGPSGNPASCEGHAINPSEWCKEGIVDVLSPQLYWGMTHPTCPFKNTLEKWLQMSAGANTKVMPSFSVGYMLQNKVPPSDHDKMTQICKENTNVSGLFLFSYGKVLEWEERTKAAGGLFRPWG
ncbi:MAG: family 10 glycosylhydrolase [Oscillospiraceae bacterium]|nr:family 10 glycosylhydrolase [Oscillospiraceae bacterium]